MATRFAIFDGTGFWTRTYDHEGGNWTHRAQQATTWASCVVANQHLQKRQSYLCLTGRHNDAAALSVVEVEIETTA